MSAEDKSAAPPAGPSGGPTGGRPPVRPRRARIDLQSWGTVREGCRALLGRHHRLLLAIVLVSLLFFLLFTVGPFVSAFRWQLAQLGFDESQSWKLLAATLIYDSVMLLGIWRLMAGLGLIRREAAALDQIETRCSAYLEQPEGLPASLITSDRSFLSGGTDENPVLRKTAAFKMTENVRLDALGRRFDPVNLIVDRVLGNVTAQSLGLRDAQQLGVRLGILGTFCGIVVALSHVGSIVHSDTIDNAVIQQAINLIVRNLGVAFATSIAGLSASILVQLMAWSMRSRENDIVEALERTASRVQVVCRRASEDTPLGADITALRSVLEDHTQLMRRQEKDLIAVSSRFGDALLRTENVLAQPIAALETTGQRLEGLLGAQSAAIGSLERMTGSVKELEERVAGHFEASATQSAEAQRQALQRVADVVKLSFDTVTAEIRTGWGQQSLKSFESIVERHLSDTATRLDAVADRQLRASLAIARNLALAMILAAASLLVVVGETSGLFAAIAALVFGTS